MTTEAEVLANIFAWSVDSPNWQRDALRRLVTQTALAPAEIDDLLAICKGDAQAIPLETKHLREPSGNSGSVYLRQVHGVRHVNALASDQRLLFHRSGLTIIYGDNGSGKSGYARILKKVCRARMPSRIEEIVPDIYDPTPGIPCATIEYSINDQNHTCAWQLGQAVDSALSAVSVFDSRTANIHVDEANDVAYTPFPLKLLSGLAQLCKSIKDKLSAEIEQIKTQTPEVIKKPTCNGDSAVGKFVTQLSPDTAPATVEAIATFTQTDQERLARLTADLASDPVRAARQLAILKAKIDGYIVRLNKLFASINDDSVNNLRLLAIDCAVTHEAAAVASGALFSNEPLPHIGSEAWQALWRSARAFSNTEAYPDKHFPAIDAGSVCVLCQQELSPVAAERLNRFETFARDDSQKRAEEARIAYDGALAIFANAAVSLTEHADIGYMGKETISSNLNRIIPNASRYHFGVLTSCVHMAWTRSVCGRLKSDYRYSGAIVYNNFPWPDATDEQKAIIEKLAQDILAARMLYPDSTLADMYSENSMPFHPELVKAHQALDRAVMKLYGFARNATEPIIVAALMERYQWLVRNPNNESTGGELAHTTKKFFHDSA